MKGLRGTGGSQIGDTVAMSIGALGENIAVKRGVFVMSDHDARLGYYVHAAGKVPFKMFEKHKYLYRN